MNNLM